MSNDDKTKDPADTYTETRKKLRKMRVRKSSVRDMKVAVSDAIDVESKKVNPDITGMMQAITLDTLDKISESKKKSRTTSAAYGETCKSVLPPSHEKSERDGDTDGEAEQPDTEDHEGDGSEQDADSLDDDRSSD